MSSHCGFVVEVKDLRPHSNADKLQLATFFGETVVVGLEVKVGDIGIYFPSDLQLSIEYCDSNDLCRTKANGTPGNGYLDRNKRNVTAIRLRGEKSYGLYMPISSLDFTGIDISTLTIGTTIDTVNGILICQKYIPHRSGRAVAGGVNHTRKKKANQNIFPYFVEHIDTPQLRFNMSMFKPGDIICLTEKVHGTSSRNGYALTQPKKKWFHRLFRLEPKVHYSNIAGTRRTLISPDNAGYYGTNEFRDYWANKFINKLHPGEQVFGEIAGFYDINCPIMSPGNNHKLKDKSFVAAYGDTTTFTYGCSADGKGAPLNRYFIYRMTYTTPEGYVIEYPWDLVQLRAEQMGFEVVPELERFIYTTEEDFMSHITQWLDAPSFLDARHIREGVVVRALNASSFKVAKEKSWSFKVLEGIIKEVSETPDLEEIEDLL